MNRPVHFEMGCEDPDRAAKFYSDLFGWKVSKWGGPMEYFLVDTGPNDQTGINGGFMRSNETEVVRGTVNTIEVADLDGLLEQVTRQGGQIVSPKAPIPGIGYIAYCQDTEGNTFGMIQMHPEAS